MRKDHVIARCISCVGEVWELRSEPIAEGLGLTMYTSKGKAIAAGVGKIDSRGITCKLNTLYPGITNRTTITFGITVTPPNPDEPGSGWSVTGGGTVSR